MNEKEKNNPRGYVLFLDIKIALDMESIKYYIGVPMTKIRKDCKWVYTISRKHALIFKDNRLIGKFVSMYNKEIKNIPNEKWNGFLYIQDVDSPTLIIDHLDLNKF